MQEIVAGLLADTAALGVWLLGMRDELLAVATKSPSIERPIKVLFEGETHIEPWIFAQRIGWATIVVTFDEQSSLGLIRLRVRNAKAALERALAGRSKTTMPNN